MYKYIVAFVYIAFLIVMSLVLASCVAGWEENRKLNEEIFYEYMIKPIAQQPVPGQPYEVPPLPEGGGMLHPNPLLEFDEYSLASAPKAIPVEYQH